LSGLPVRPRFESQSGWIIQFKITGAYALRLISQKTLTIFVRNFNAFKRRVVIFAKQHREDTVKTIVTALKCTKWHYLGMHIYNYNYNY